MCLYSLHLGYSAHNKQYISLFLINTSIALPITWHRRSIQFIIYMRFKALSVYISDIQLFEHTDMKHAHRMPAVTRRMSSKY